MEFANLGRHCDLASCHQKDFLPFRCDKCGGTFCLEHRSLSAHSCEVDLTKQNVIPQCPMCNQFVLVKSGENPDTVVNAHISRGCKAFVLGAKKDSKAAPPAEPRAQPPPQQKPEKEKAGLKLLEKLKKDREAKEAAQPAAPKKGADKVQNARLRMNAVGEKHVPEKDRFYLEVLYSRDVKADDKGSASMFFNREWTVGRVVDSICTQLGVENRNHEKDARKLVLVPRRTSAALPFDLALHLLEPQLCSGDTVALQYAQ